MADLTPKDLNELARGARNLAGAQGDLAKASVRAARGIDDVHDEAKRAFSQVSKLEDQISALTKAARPLDGVLGKFNDQLERQITLSRQAAEALREQVKAAEQAAKIPAGPAASAANEPEKKHTGPGLSKKESQKLGEGAIDAIAALAKGDEPMEVLIDLGAEVAKMFQEAALEGVSFSAELRRLGVSTGLVKASAAEAAVAQSAMKAATGGAAAAGAELTAMNAVVAESATAATAAEGAMLGPLLLIGAAAAAAFALFEREVDKNTKHATTWADTWNASVTVIGKALTSGPIGVGLKFVGEAFGKTLDWIVKGFTSWYDNAVGFFVGAFVAVTKNWSRLPEVFGVIILAAANKIISGLQFIIDGAIGGLNFLLKKAKLPEMGPFKLPKFEMPKSDVAKSVQAEIDKATAAIKEGREKLGKDIAKQADKEFEKRQKTEKKGGSGSAGVPKAAEVASAEDNKAQLEAQRIQQLQAINGYNDQIDRINAALASTLEKRNEIETRSLEARQKVEAEVLTSQLAKQVEDKKVSKDDAEAQKKAQGQLHDAQRRQQFVAQQVAVQKEALTAAQAGRQNDIDLLTSQGALTTSVSAQLETEEKIRKLRFEIAVADQQAVIDRVKLGQGTEREAELAEARIAVLIEINENDKKLAERQHKLLNAYVAAIEAFSGMAKSVLDGDVGGTITGLSNTFSKVSSLMSKDSGIGKALGSAAGFLGPVGSAVSAVTGVLGAIGQRSAEKAQAKLAELNKGVEDLRTANMASSNSIAGALEEANRNWNGDLEFSSEMLVALRSIDNQIGALASGISQSIATGKLMSTAGLAIGKTGGGGLFGSSSNTELLDQGLTFNPTTYGALGEGGLTGSTYADLVTTKTKKFLGVTTGVKVSTSTVSGAIDGDLLNQVAGVIQRLGDGVLAAASIFGEEAGGAAKQALETAQIDIGKLSLKGLSSEEIEKLLNATFSKVGDDLAKAGVPGLETLADVGEGAFETLIRLAREYEVVDTSLSSIGMTFKTVGLQSLAARDALVEAAGGLDAFTSQTAFFAEHFLSEDERLKPVKESVTGELTRLKLPTDLTREGFKSTVLGLDVSTKEGAELYAAMMKLAPAFDKVASAAEATKAAVEDKAKSIQDRIDDLVMTPAQKLAKSRAAEEDAVKALDASLVPLLKSLWAVEDAAKDAADAAEVEAKAKALAKDRSTALADLLDVQGYTDLAKGMRRDLALADVEDEVQRDYMRRTWAAQDAAEKVSAARDVLTQAYQREQEAIQATKDKFKELSASLRTFSGSLTDTIAGIDPGARYRRTRETFLSTAAMARLGDPDAMGRLQSEGEAFTAASRDYVSTSLDYLRDVGLVRSAVDEAADTADRQVSIAQRQLDALDASVQGLIQINASVVSVEQAIFSLRGALAEARSAGVVSVGGSNLGLGNPAPPTTAPNTGGSAVDLSKTLDGKYHYDLMIGQIAYTESLRDPAFYAEHNIPFDVMIPGTQAYSVLQTFKVRNKDLYDEYERQRLIQGYATGGSFEVGGSGPPDSKFFGLALSPGEAVNVQRADQKGDKALIQELQRLREELAELRATSARIATSNDKMERTLTNVTEGGRAMQTQAAA